LGAVAPAYQVVDKQSRKRWSWLVGSSRQQYIDRHYDLVKQRLNWYADPVWKDVTKEATRHWNSKTLAARLDYHNDSSHYCNAPMFRKVPGIDSKTSASLVTSHLLLLYSMSRLLVQYPAVAVHV
jgi:hypothetical protein